VTAFPAPAPAANRRMTAAQVAALFAVSEETVARWSRTGRLTRYGARPGWYLEAEVRALYDWQPAS